MEAAAKSAPPLTPRQIILWMTVSIAAFHLAYLIPGAGVLMVAFLYGLVRLTEAPSSRKAFYPALLVGIACYAPHLWFFTGIFGWIAISLWTILSLPLGFFVLIVRALARRAELPRWVWVLLVPVVWTGLEYFRCEMYYLKFAWLTVGMAMGARGFVDLTGSYGIGFLLAACAAYVASLPRVPLKQAMKTTRWRRTAAVGIVLVTLIVVLPLIGEMKFTTRPMLGVLKIVGVQLELPSTKAILDSLDQAVSDHPDVTLLVMSEYSMEGPPPEEIKAWCRLHERYLIIGGVQPFENLPTATDGKKPWADTAFVIDPKGDVVFSQGKSVPIQFMSDGVPAKEQKVWQSPWGKIGICICYDMSYTRVVDELVRQGAKVLIVPTMDVEKWGAYQHALHARVTTMRAAEYHLPIVRVASSGISQMVDRNGRETSRAGFAVRGAMVEMNVDVREMMLSEPRLPLDRLPAQGCMIITGGVVGWLMVRWGIRRFQRKGPKHAQA